MHIKNLGLGREPREGLEWWRKAGKPSWTGLCQSNPYQWGGAGPGHGRPDPEAFLGDTPK